MLRRRPTVRGDRNPGDSAPVPGKAGGAFLSAFQAILTAMASYQARIPVCTVACKHAGWC